MRFNKACLLFAIFIATQAYAQSEPAARRDS